MSNDNDTKNPENLLRSRTKREPYSLVSSKKEAHNALYGEELRNEIQANKDMLSSPKLYSF
jgi:hypothetical protein